jgi:thiol-disulfide isomerase/thioredoxin
MTAPQHPEKPRGFKRVVVLATGILAGLATGVAAVYGIGVLLGNRAGDTPCWPAVETARRVAPFAHGEVAAVAAATKALLVPDLTFRDATGTEKRLADWSGRTVLFNLWATWCIPCRKEMPALDELQAKLGGPGFEVVSVNIDTRDPDKPRTWLKEAGITRLAYYADASAKVFQDLKLVGRAFGMPTTLLVDPMRCEIAYIAGPAEWASEDAIKLVSAALGSQPSDRGQ